MKAPQIFICGAFCFLLRIACQADILGDASFPPRGISSGKSRCPLEFPQFWR
jgi:hypothetical protein